MGACVSDPAGGCDPTRPEVCRNGVDDDCDGVVDEGCDPTTACASDTDCAPRQFCCSGVCADPLSDPAHCGGCGFACTMGTSCSDGVCGGACDPSDPRCPPSCVPAPEDCAN